MQQCQYGALILMFSHFAHHGRKPVSLNSKGLSRPANTPVQGAGPPYSTADKDLSASY